MLLNGEQNYLKIAQKIFRPFAGTDFLTFWPELDADSSWP